METLGARLEQFIAACNATAYTEPPDNLAFHAKITKDVWAKVKWAVLPAEGKNILDLGCANGFAQKMFVNDGFDPAGIVSLTCSEADARQCWADNPNIQNVTVLDMHRIGELSRGPDPDPNALVHCYLSCVFDLVWARHVLEHSPIPLFLLQEIRQVLTPGTGKLYIEVPAPDTACRHTTNVNHFSCFGREGWDGLIDKAGFTPIETFDIEVKVPAGDDRYYCWLLGLK
jgi:SAM-dependent methyltransferase